MLPEIIDPSNIPVSLNAKIDSKFFEYDDSTRKITQIKTIDSSVNQTLEFTLKNKHNLTAVYTMNVIFICPLSEKTSNFTPPTQHKLKTSNVKVPFPVRITSISRTGIVEIQFKLSV